MSVLVNEEAYARELRRSARETARQLRQRDLMDGQSRDWGGLRAAVLDAIGATPVTVAAISDQVGRGAATVTCVLRRLEAQGLAAGAGTTRNKHGQPVTLWVRTAQP